MDNNLGTYKYGEFSSNDDELQRLKRQAKVAWSIEKDYLVAHGLRNGITVADLACVAGIISVLM